MRRVLLAVALLLLAPASAQVSDHDWPLHDDVTAALDAAAEHPWVTVHEIGASVSGKTLRIAEITDPGSPVPMEERVVTLLLTQQHGNEPASTPAALALLEDIQAGTAVADLLSDQVLLLWPQVNPDGAEAVARTNQNGTDLNRDHITLEAPETQALHRVLQEWDVHVAIDHHEYGGTGLGYPSPVRIYDYDITALYPRHGNVRTPTVDAAADLLYDGLWPALDEAGYSHGEYGTTTLADIDLVHTSGGPDPGILRNNFGLHNIAGLLVESFIPLAPNPLITAERRIDAHRTVMDAALQYARDHADGLRAAKAESVRLNREEPLVEYVEEWPDDPVTGQPNAGNIRAALGEAYRTTADLDGLMALHGLPAGVPDGEGRIYPVQGDRAGLVAAIIHPGSSRTQAPAAVAVAAPLVVVSAEGDDENHAAAAGPVITMAALAAVAMALRRRS